MTGPQDHTVTEVLRAIGAGDPRAAEHLWPLVYEELRRLAHQRMAGEAPGRTIQATALVHEAYLRLVGDESVRWDNRAHFFSAAATAMRRILVEEARKRRARKHGGGRARVDLDQLEITAEDSASDTLDHLPALDEALDRLETMDPRKSRVVMLRYFAGLTIEQTAKALALSATIVKDEWHFARAWLYGEIMRHEQAGT